MQDFNGGQIVDSITPLDSSSRYPVVRSQCFPLHLLLRAINRTTVDYFSLDVEGFELNVLRTIPFDSIHIKVRQDKQRGVKLQPTSINYV